MTEVHLRAAQRIPVTILLFESKNAAEPVNRLSEILVGDVRHQDVRRDRTIRDHLALQLATNSTIQDTTVRSFALASGTAISANRYLCGNSASAHRPGP